MRLIRFVLGLMAAALVAAVDVTGGLARRPLLGWSLVLSLTALLVAGVAGLLVLGAVAVALPVLWARLAPTSYQRLLGWRLLGRWQQLVARADRVRLGNRPVADELGPRRGAPTPGVARATPPGPASPRPGCGHGHHGTPRDAAGLCPDCDEVLAGVADPADPGRMVWFDPLDTKEQAT